jgi:O-antigen/teichoic acid export membrane protein
MTFKRNIIASYASQIYSTLLGITILPMYLKYMGAETYGLIGLFTMLQVWFNLLDIGLTPTVARETARLRAGASDTLSYRRLLRALQIIFFSVALAGGSVLFYFSGDIAAEWLHVQSLPLTQVQLSLQFMSIAVALRWMAGLYRACISGSEEIAWLGGFNALMATIRFLGILPILIWIKSTPIIFFSYQLLIATTELFILAIKAKNLLPSIPHDGVVGWSPIAIFTPIKPVLKFALTMALASSVWVLVTQTDKLLLSRLLSLAEYGHYTLAALAASSVMMVSGPISNALLPRMALLEAQGNKNQLLQLYRDATQWVGILVMPTCAILSLHAERILWIWTGNIQLASKTAPVLSLYALGNGVMAISAFPFYIQFAKGKLRQHLLGTFLFMLLLLPTLIWATDKYGAIGAGWAWLASNLSYFLIWTPIAHSIYAPNLHLRWIIHDIAPILLISLLTALLSLRLPWPEQRYLLFLQLLLVSLITISASIFSSSWARLKLFSLWNANYQNK